jgi:hypothetical protein
MVLKQNKAGMMQDDGSGKIVSGGAGLVKPMGSQILINEKIERSEVVLFGLEIGRG